MTKLVARFIKNESGATAIEYALIAAGIALVIIASLTLVGDDLKALFAKVSTGLKAN